MTDSAPHLRIHAHVDGVETPQDGWLFRDDETVQIGRHNSCDIILTHPQISRSHATFFYKDGQWRYSSYGTNGSFVDGIEVAQILVEDEMEIRLGTESWIQVQFEDPNRLPGTGSVTFHLGEMKSGNSESVQELWGRCFSMIARLAQQQLSGANKRMADEEDVAASVFESLFFGAVDGKFPDVNDRNSLWRLIVVMTRRKAADYIAHERRLKRGGGKVRGDSIGPGDRSTNFGPSVFDSFVSEEPTPDAIAILEEQTGNLLGELPDDEHREIALLRLQGMTNPEISDKLKVSLRTVERRLHQIRVIWERELALSE